MPKTALTFNGFGGGINLDADDADLASNGSSAEDEVKESTNLYLDMQGKIVAEYPTVKSADGLYPVITTGYTQATTGVAWTVDAEYTSTPIAATTYAAGTGATNTGADVTFVYTTNGSGVPTFTFVNTGQGLVVGNTFQCSENGSSLYYTITVVAINSTYYGAIVEDSSIYDSSATKVLVFDNKLYRAEGVYKHGEVVLYNKFVDYMSFTPTTGEIGPLAPAAQTDGIDLWFRPDRRPIEDTIVDNDALTWPGKGSKGSINIFLGSGARGWGSHSTTNGAILFDKQKIAGIGAYIKYHERQQGVAAAGSSLGLMGATERAELYNITNTIGDFQTGEPTVRTSADELYYYGGSESQEIWPQDEESQNGIQICGGVQVVATGGTAFTFSDKSTDKDDDELIDFATNDYDTSGSEANETLDDEKSYCFEDQVIDLNDCTHEDSSVPNSSIKDFLFCKMHDERTNAAGEDIGTAEGAETETAWGGASNLGEKYGPAEFEDNDAAIWSTTPVLWFGVGKWDPAVTANTPSDGAYGQYCPAIEGKILRLQIKIKTAGMVVGDAIDGIYIAAHTGEIKNHNLIYDHQVSLNCKTWYVSRVTLLASRNANDGNDSWSEIEIPVSNYLYSGGDYEGDDKIHSFLIWPKLAYSENAELAANKILMKLREFSFVETITSGWAAYDYVKLFQTKLVNGIESLPAAYTTSNTEDGVACPNIHKIRTDAQEMLLRKPSASTTAKKGKIYYQGCDEKGVVFGEKYLLAEYDYAEGVKWSGTDDVGYTPWVDTGTVPFGMNAAGATDANAVIRRFEDPPIASTYSLETGYPDNAETINALFKTASTVGRQVYIGNVAKQKPHDSSTAAKAQPFTTGTYAESAENRFVFNNSGSYCRWGVDGTNNWANHGYSVGDSFVVVSGLTDVAANQNVVFEITAITDYQATITPAPTDATDEDVAKIIFVFEAYDKSLLLKTPPGNAAGFPDSLYIDLEFGGDEITVLESTADRLLVFSKHKLTIINIAQDVEFIEATMDHMGISNNRQICKVAEGFAWVNAGGVFYFDGQQVNPISSNKLITAGWSDDTSAIAYDISRDFLWTWVGNETVYYYCFTTQSFVGYSTSGDSDFYNLPDTNAVAGNLGFTHYAKGTTAAKRHFFLGTSTNISATLDRDILWQSGKIDCGNMGAKKRFYDVYVTCKNTGLAIVLWWRTGTTWYKGETNGYKGQTTNANHGLIGQNQDNGFGPGTTRVGLSNAGSAPKANGRWIQLKIEDISNNAQSALEIGDITIIFRQKTVK